MANPRPQREAILALTRRKVPRIAWAKTGDPKVEVFSVGESPIALHGISKPSLGDFGPWVAVFVFGDVDATVAPITWDELRRCEGAVLLQAIGTSDFCEEVVPLRSVRAIGSGFQFACAGDSERYNPI